VTVSPAGESEKEGDDDVTCRTITKFKGSDDVRPDGHGCKRDDANDNAPCFRLFSDDSVCVRGRNQTGHTMPTACLYSEQLEVTITSAAGSACDQAGDDAPGWKRGKPSKDNAPSWGADQAGDDAALSKHSRAIDDEHSGGRHRAPLTERGFLAKRDVA
jgi:hypothetical protein